MSVHLVHTVNPTLTILKSQDELAVFGCVACTIEPRIAIHLKWLSNGAQVWLSFP